jgi:hypothetical protein
MKTTARTMKVSHLEEKKDNPFNRANSDHVSQIQDAIESGGYDDSQPVIINEDCEVVDGRHRVLAAKAAGLSSIPVVEITWSCERKHFQNATPMEFKGAVEKVLRAAGHIDEPHWTEADVPGGKLH